MTNSNLLTSDLNEGVIESAALAEAGLESSSSSAAGIDTPIPQDQPVIEQEGLPEESISQQPEELLAEEEGEGGVNPLQEVASVVGGGAIDAVESVGGFAELTGDTLKTGLSKVLGRDPDREQNPFDEEYKHGDGNWLNVPDQITGPGGNVLWEDAQPKTAIGKFGRGLVEFGLLTWATGGVGGATLGGARLGVRGVAAARAMGVGAKGSRMLKLIPKGVKIGSEGAIADLISSSSEHANIMNLAQENIPWAVPIIGDMIAVKPEDNPWTARFKSIAAGAGLNYVGHAVGAIYKGFWDAGRARKAGKSVDEANAIGMDSSAKDFEDNMRLDEDAHVDMALDEYQQGVGISRAEPKDEYARSYGSPEEYDEFVTARENNDPRADELFEEFKARGSEANDNWYDDLQSNDLRLQEDTGRQKGPFTNDPDFSQSERATYRAPENSVKQHLSESLESTKQGSDGSSYTPITSETYLRSMSRGDKNIRQYIEEVANDITDAAFGDVENRLPWKDVKLKILKDANDLMEILEGGGDIAKNFQKHLDDVTAKGSDLRLYSDNGTKTVTISPTQKAANVLVMNALGKQVHAIATGAMTISDNIPIGRQADQIFDAMKVLLTENKKMGLMWGLDGKAQQQFTLSPTLDRMKQRSMAVITHQTDEYINSLRQLIKKERWDELEDLVELHQLSGGKVRTLQHIHEYLRAVLKGGRMDDVHIKGRIRKELQGTFFNSVLSSFSTPVKAIGGTNMITMLRPLQAFIGAGLRGKNREMFMASAQMTSMGNAWAESLTMARHNWELGVKKKGQTYQGKFDFDQDLQSWKGLKKHYERYGSATEKIAYGALDKVVDINTMPWVKYSVNAMGAGDAAARTMIGRQYMRMRSAGAAWDEATGNGAWVDSNQLKNMAIKGEDNFRDEIFKLNEHDMYVVSDKGASMAGDEAAMTRALQENFKGFELISNIPGMKAFFPFVRTGFNYLDVTFQHTPLQLFRDKYTDLKQLANKPNPNPILLQKYGIRPEDAAYELALMEGRIAMGTAVSGLVGILAMQGRVTGNMPVNEADREQWKLNGIQPRSFKVADGTYVSYDKLEIFNTLFALQADVLGNQDILGQKATDEWMKKSVFMTSAVLVDQSMLAGVEDLARLMNPTSAEDLLLKSGTRYLRSHLPYSGLMGQIGDITDSNQKEANTFLELIARRDAHFKNSVPDKYDVLNKDRSGIPLRYGPEQPLWRAVNSVSPIAITNFEGDEVKEALHMIRYNMPNELSTYQGQQLNSSEKSEMEKILAQSDLRKDLAKVIKHSSFQNALKEYKSKNLKESDGYKLKDQIFYRAVSEVFRKHKALAIKQLLVNNPNLAGRLKLGQTQKQMGRSGQYGNAQQIEYLISQFPK